MSDVFILDVGHGNCTIITDEGATAIIDSPVGSALIDTLEELGVAHVEYALISHSDADHLQGILALLTSTRVSVRHLYLNPDADKNSTAWRDLLKAVRVASRSKDFEPHTSLSQTDPGTLHVGQIKISIVSPSPALALSGVGGTNVEGTTNSANTLSAVIKVERAQGTGVLLAGDMDAAALEDILQSKTDLSASVLVYPHHGGLPGSGSADDFVAVLLELVMPMQVYVSNGRNKFNNPRPEIVEAIRSRGCGLACTQLAKACGDPVENPSLEKWPSAGRDRNFSCAGTISLTLGSTGAVRDAPFEDAFREFVRSRVSTPMCLRKG